MLFSKTSLPSSFVDRADLAERSRVKTVERRRRLTSLRAGNPMLSLRERRRRIKRLFTVSVAITTLCTSTLNSPKSADSRNPSCTVSASLEFLVSTSSRSTDLSSRSRSGLRRLFSLARRSSQRCGRRVTRSSSSPRSRNLARLCSPMLRASSASNQGASPFSVIDGRKRRKRKNKHDVLCVVAFFSEYDFQF